jgi:hypothetical protein
MAARTMAFRSVSELPVNISGKLDDSDERTRNIYADLMRKFSHLRFASALLCIAVGSAADSGASRCSPEVAGVRFTCPVGWSILNQNQAHPGQITIGDFSPSSDARMKNVIPAGKNTITILPKPPLYATD